MLLALYLCTMVAYFSWRVFMFNTEQLVFSAVFFAAELATLVLALMSIVILWQAKPRSEKRPKPGLKVDVFVPTYNEALPLVRRTVIAAMAIDYPHQTWLLDDGDRPQMRALAKELNCHYLARQTNKGAKPGNLNHALAYSEADFIAVVDCDHIAQRDYLDRLLGHFDDPQVAFVQAPQDYYNTEAFQYRNDAERGLLWHDQSSFFATGQVGRDYWDATTCCGTSTIVRRRVVDEIGGFPEETVTEDIHLAIKAQKLGYKSVYYPLPLAYGVAPVDLGEFQKQRLRWGQGNVQAIREEGLPFTRKLSFGQNVGYSYLGFLYAEGWARLVFYLAPPAVFLTGSMPIAPTHDFLWYFLPFFLVTILYFEEASRGNFRFHVNEQMAMARFPVFIASTFAVMRKRIRWQVSSKEFVGHFQVYLLAPQLAVFALNFAIGLWAIVAPNHQLIEHYSLPMYCFGVLWCGFNCVLALKVVQNSVRCAKNKRADYRFALDLPVQIDRANGSAVTAVTSRISATGMSFFADKSLAVDQNIPLDGRLFMPGLTVPFTAMVEAELVTEPSSENQMRRIPCQFNWEHHDLRDKLDLSLHACVWHRILVWDGHYFLTPLQRLAKWLGLNQEPEISMKARRCVLYRALGAATGELKLGLLLEAPENMRTEFVTFEHLKTPQTIDIVWQHNHPGHTSHVLATPLGPAEIASAGTNDVKMYRYELSKREASGTHKE